LPARTKHSLVTLLSSKGFFFFFFFLANISVILYKAMVAALALLILLDVIVNYVSNPQLCFYVFCCCWDIYLCSLYIWWLNVIQHYMYC